MREREPRLRAIDGAMLISHEWNNKFPRNQRTTDVRSSLKFIYNVRLCLWSYIFINIYVWIKFSTTGQKSPMSVERCSIRQPMHTFFVRKGFIWMASMTDDEIIKHIEDEDQSSSRNTWKYGKEWLCWSCMIVLTHFLSLTFAHFVFIFFFFLLLLNLLFALYSMQSATYPWEYFLFLLGDATHMHTNQSMTFVIESQPMYGCTHADPLTLCV